MIYNEYNIYHCNTNINTRNIVDTQILFSDVGDVLIPTDSLLEIQKNCLYDLVHKEKQHVFLEKKEIYSLFKPYKILSQTKNSLSESIDMFFKKYSINSKYDDYRTLYELYSKDISPLRLNDGVVETLELLDSKNISVILLSDAVDTGEKLSECLRDLILLEKNLASKEKLNKKLNMNRYIKGYYSSKDFGVKKDNNVFIDILFSKLNLTKIDTNSLGFVGHDFDELSAMAEHDIKIYYIDAHKNDTFPSNWNRINAFSDFMNIDNISLHNIKK